MKKTVFTFFILLAVALGEKDSVVVHLTPCEEVLAGVILLENLGGIDREKQTELYKELLGFSDITHEEFRAFLDEHRTEPEKWFKIMERVSSSKK